MDLDAGESRTTPSAVVFAASFLAILALHWPLLHLPYFWDEAGYYVPAARDLLLLGTVIPHSTPSNAHPPLVMAYLALCWKLAGYSPVVTRVAMLLVASFSLTGLFRLSERVSNRRVAIATLCCTAVYPVFFVQSSLAQVDLAAAGLTFWALNAYVSNRRVAVAVWFTLAVMAKETAVLAPAALLTWEAFHRAAATTPRASAPDKTHWGSRCIALAVPLITLSFWYVFHYRMTGYVLGNPEYFRYNVQTTLSPLRSAIALVLRLWQSFGYLNLWVLTAAMAFAMCRSPLIDGETERNRIPVRVQVAFLAIAVAYVVFMSLVGGAVLARYMLPVVPLVILVAISTLWRRVRLWIAVVAVVVVGFTVALFVAPPYGFSLEDNLAYRDYIVMHQHAANFLRERYPSARILTAWPASDEISTPYLGYVDRPLRVVRIENFSQDQVISAAGLRPSYDVALVFSTKYQPPHPWFARWQAWQDLKSHFFGYHRDLPPQAIAQILDGNIDLMDARGGQWIAVISMERIQEARATTLK